MRSCHGRPIFVMELPIPGKTVFILRQSSEWQLYRFVSEYKQMLYKIYSHCPDLDIYQIKVYYLNVLNYQRFNCSRLRLQT